MKLRHTNNMKLNYLRVLALVWAFKATGCLLVVAQEAPNLTDEERRAIEAARPIFDEARERRLKEQAQKLLDKLSSKDYLERVNAISRLQTLELPAEQGVPLFRALLSNPDWVVREGASRGLAAYREKAIEAIPDLIKLLDEQHRNEGTAVARALGAIAPHDSNVIAALERVLSDSRAEGLCLLGAAESVAQIGISARQTAPALTKLLQHRLGYVQYAAYKALSKVNGDRDLTVDAAIQILQNFKDEAPEKTSDAFFSLQRAGVNAKKALPVLAQLARQNSEVYVRCASFEAMGQIGPGSDSSAVKVLLDSFSFRDESGATSRCASAALNKIGLGDVEAIAPLIEAIEKSPLTRIAAVGMIGRIGSEAKPAIPAIIKIIQQENDNIQSSGSYLASYANVLAEIGVGDDRAMNAIFDLFRPDSPWAKKTETAKEVHPALFAALAGVGVPKEGVKRNEVLLRVNEALEEGSKERNPYLFAGAAKVAGALGPDAAATVPVLLRALQVDFKDAIMTSDSRPSMMAIPAPTAADRSFLSKGHGKHSGFTTARLEVIRALGKIGKASAPAIPILTSFAQSKDDAPQSFYRDDAIRALRAIGAPLPPGIEPIAALGEVTPETAFADLQGAARQIKELRGQIAVFVFVDTQCPCVRAYSSRVAELEKKYKERGVRVIYVFSSPFEDKDKVQQFVGEQKFSWMVVQDKDQNLAKVFDAQSTSESFLIDKDGVLRYHGRIDDNIYKPELVKERNLEDAIVAVLNNQRVPKAETEIRSCVIPRL